LPTGGDRPRRPDPLIGHDTVEKPPFTMRQGGPKVVDIYFNRADIDQIILPDIEVVGRLANRLYGKLSHDANYFLNIRKSLLAHTGEGRSRSTGEQ
jgi:hypothetical protein